MSGSGAIQPWPNTQDDRPANLRHGGKMTRQQATLLAGMQRPILRLNYNAAIDLANGVAVAASPSWTSIGTAQSFSWSGPTATGIAWVGGDVFGGATAALLSARLLIDGTPTTTIGGTPAPNTSTAAFANYLTGARPIYLASLAAGTHTIQLQVTANVAAIAYCRAASGAPFESLSFLILELAP